LIEIMRRLRDPTPGCPWSYRAELRLHGAYTIEGRLMGRRHERTGDMAELKAVGDLLLQTVYHAGTGQSVVVFRVVFLVMYGTRDAVVGGQTCSGEDVGPGFLVGLTCDTKYKKRRSGWALTGHRRMTVLEQNCQGGPMSWLKYETNNTQEGRRRVWRLAVRHGQPHLGHDPEAALHRS
jgi:hypothetical protein